MSECVCERERERRMNKEREVIYLHTQSHKSKIKANVNNIVVLVLVLCTTFVTVRVGWQLLRYCCEVRLAPHHGLHVTSNRVSLPPERHSVGRSGYRKQAISYII